MALLGCGLIGVKDPTGADRKKLLIWVEIDRCMTDALSAVTGVRLGRRSMKFVDYGKVAATFYNTETGKSIRIVARDESRELADSKYPHVEKKKERQLLTYREASDEELFKIEQVIIDYGDLDAPGRTRSRVKCSMCDEGINDGKGVVGQDGATLCRSCSSGGYYRRQES